MRFFGDMLTKDGFADGDMLPDGIDSFREVYIKAVNHFAEVFESSYRAVPFDRSGLHNPCLILFMKAEDVGKNIRESAVAVPHRDTDEAFQKAIYRAYELNLDDYLITQVTIDADALEDALVNNSDV